VAALLERTRTAVRRSVERIRTATADWE
jgi:hypothetical protein